MSISRRGDGFCAARHSVVPVSNVFGITTFTGNHRCALSDTHTHDHQCCCGFEWPRTEDDQ